MSTNFLQILTVTNNDDGEVSIDCLYKTAPWLEVHTSPTVLKSGDKVDIPIRFMPRSEQKYREIVPFDVNGLQTINVEVLGEGIKGRVELVNEEQQTISFGAVRIGQKQTVTVPIVNRSKKLANVNLSKSMKPLLAKYVTFVPNGAIQIKPKETVNMEVTFEPKSRIPQFSEELLMDVEGFSVPLLFISGTGINQYIINITLLLGHGIELKLESDITTFASVVQNGSSSQKLRLINIGDIATKFKWDTAKFLPDFSISPSEGFLSPGMDVILKITFTPTKVAPDIRYSKLPCYVEGLANPLLITLAGSCVPQSENEVIAFKVREMLATQCKFN
jgi:hydrocephalus-inducing protein